MKFLYFLTLSLAFMFTQALPQNIDIQNRKILLPSERIIPGADGANISNPSVNIINAGSALTMDVGMVSLGIPNSINPGDMVPNAVVKNFGSDAQTFDVTLNISPGGYSSTQTVTNLNPDSSTTLIFSNWTAAVGGNYTASVFTQLAGDLNTANDTINSIIEAMNITWQPLTATPNVLSRSCPVYVTEGANDYIYQFGGGVTAQLVSVARYDVTAGTWLNTGFAAIPSNISSGTAIAVGDSNIYLFGGETGAGLGKTYKYNHYTNVWAIMAPMLTPVTDALVVKFWNNNLIYVLGGGDGIFDAVAFNTVQVYNIQSNTWSTATSLPAPVTMMGGGIINNKIIYAGGWNVKSVPDVYIGTIDITDPTQITWNAAGKYPADTINGITRMASFPVVTGKGAGIVFAGGAISGAYITNKSYLWNFCTNQWIEIPGMPVGRSNLKIASKYIPATFYGNEVYTVAGYNGSSPLGNFEKLTLGSIPGTCYQPLPVELTSFAAVVSGNNVSLRWSTSTETNNRGFEVERKSEGGSFKSLGFISGKGTTTEIQSYMIVDYNVPAGKYYYRLKQNDMNGTLNYSKEVFADVSVPVEFSLSQNYPNPFNPATSIKFGLKFDSKVTLKIFNVLGQLICTLVNSDLKAGYYNEQFNASNLSSGIYLYTIEAVGNNGQNFTAAKKLVLLK